MLIPLRTDRPPKRKPLVTEGLIVLNLAVYLFGLASEYGDLTSMEEIIRFAHFDPRDFKVWGLVTYQFLHDPSAIWHLAFNMLFLWIFGCAVEDRLGHVGFLGFYLLGGIFAAIAHMIVEPAPVIGASGSIAAVTGAFLGLFPRSRIKVLFFFFIIGIYEIPALWFIGLFFVIDVFRQVMASTGGGHGNVAYMAHIAGYIYGFAVAFTLLGTGLLKHEEFDIFYLFKQSRRRAAFRAATRSTPGGGWDTPAPSPGSPDRRTAAPQKRSEEDRLRSAFKAKITRLIRDRDLPAAASEYVRLLEEHPATVLPEQDQLDIANQLYADGCHAHAASAYRLFLEHYGSSFKATEVTLLLGLLLARHLGQPERAVTLIREAQAKLTDEDQKQLAEQLLSELTN